MKHLKNSTSVVVAIICLIALIATILVSAINKKTIPTVDIKLNNISLSEINNNSKDKKYKDNTITINHNNKNITKQITLKGRGNTTWTWDKKSYQISFDEAEDILQLGKAKKWLLIGNYIDESLMRTPISLFVSKLLDMKYTVKGTFINLNIDDDYQGVYYLTNKIEISDNSVNLKNDDAILVELDNLYYFEDEYVISNTYKDHLVIKDLKKQESKETATKNFLDKYNTIEKGVEKNDWETIIENIDVESFAKVYIYNIFSANGDAFKTSCFMYQDGKDDMIHAGPIWDFDRIFRNQNSQKLNNQVYKNYIPTDDGSSTYNNYSKMFWNLLHFEEFKQITKDTWNKYMKNNLSLILDDIDKNYQLVIKDGIKNTEKWNYEKSYDEYIIDIKDRTKRYYNFAKDEIYG